MGVVLVIRFVMDKSVEVFRIYLRRIKSITAEDCIKMWIFSKIYNFVLALSGGMCYTLHSEIEVFTFSEAKMARVKYLKVENGKQIGLIGGRLPNFHHTGSIRGMKNKFYGKRALLVRCGSYIYNVTSRPDIYISAY